MCNILVNTLRLYAKTIPEKIALIEREKEICYSDLYSLITNGAAYLMSLGIHKSDSIVLSASKDLGFVYLYFAAHLIGVRNVVIEPNMSSERVGYIVRMTKPKYIFGYNYNPYKNVCIEWSNVDIPCKSCECVFTPLDENDIADVMFTTGTTGNPKGVCLSHKNIYTSASNINCFIGNGSEDIEVLGLPLSHSFGLGRVRCTLLQGGTLVMLQSFANVRLLFETIEKYHCTMFGMVPSVWQYIKKFSGTRIGKYSNQIKYIEIGSAAMSIADKKALLELFPNTRICMHYGLTEASRSIFMEFHECKDNLSTIGRPTANNISVKIVDDNGCEVPVGEFGEICIKGDTVTKTYLLETDNINSFFDNYFRTGDCGYMDKNGLYYLSGRKKEIINVGGNKVSPSLIEDAIIALGVEDCGCIPIPDNILGEVPKAYMVRGKCTLEIPYIDQLLNQQLESFQVPREYEWIDKIPRTTSGKIQRLLLAHKQNGTSYNK